MDLHEPRLGIGQAHGHWLLLWKRTESLSTHEMHKRKEMQHAAHQSTVTHQVSNDSRSVCGEANHEFLVGQTEH